MPVSGCPYLLSGIVLVKGCHFARLFQEYLLLLPPPGGPPERISARRNILEAFDYFKMLKEQNTIVSGGLKILTDDDKAGCETVKVTEDEPGVNKKRLFIESYGCQMNFSDSEIVASVMRNAGFATTSSEDDADLIFLRNQG